MSTAYLAFDLHANTTTFGWMDAEGTYRDENTFDTSASRKIRVAIESPEAILGFHDRHGHPPMPPGKRHSETPRVVEERLRSEDVIFEGLALGPCWEAQDDPLPANGECAAED